MAFNSKSIAGRKTACDKILTFKTKVSQNYCFYYVYTQTNRNTTWDDAEYIDLSNEG